MDEKLNLPIITNELPSEYADRLGVSYANEVNAKHKKDNGQFFTPLPISHLMASYCDFKSENLRILDPGCGTGVLTCSLLEYLASKNHSIGLIELIAYETDTDLIPLTENALENLKKWLLSKNIIFQFVIHTTDFVLDNSDVLNSKIKNGFDIIISNPPYFKLAKDDQRVIVTKALVSGQPNIYSLFMGIASKLLNEQGELIFITPRSFASGNYFKAFRELFFTTVQIEKIHLFNSRKDTFSRDSVLQETVIIKAIKKIVDSNQEVIVSSSLGIKDINNPQIKVFPSCKLIDLNSKEKILHLPTNDKEEHILSLAASWKHNLIDFDIHISTGPVVSFRSWDFIQDIYSNGTVFLAPLFWLHNVNKMSLEWPVAYKNKGQFIKIKNDSKSRLIANKNYILLRRFSTKDDKSRLIAAPYFCNYNKSNYIGVENKLNYIYRKNGHLERSEVAGLCTLLNSELFDTYFQIFNGNVNVSATELRGMRLPSLESIKKIGNKMIISNDYSMNNVNEIVNEYFNFKKILEK